MEILGHRGRPCADTPENTLASVRAAMDDAADGVEVDIRLTSDGVAICCHDAGLSRVAGVARGVRHLSYADLCSVRVQGHAVPTVAEVLPALPPRARLVLDLKPEHRPRRLLLAVLSALTQREDVDVVLSSSDAGILETAARLVPDVPRAVIVGTGVPFSSVLAQVLRRGDTAVHLSLRTVFNAPELVQVAQSHGVVVRVWTVNREVDARLLKVLGVDGLISDVPAVVRRALAPRRHLQLADGAGQA